MNVTIYLLKLYALAKSGHALLILHTWKYTPGQIENAFTLNIFPIIFITTIHSDMDRLVGLVVSMSDY